MSTPSEAVRRALEATDVSRLAARLGLRNEFEPGPDHPPEAIAYLRRIAATPASISDDALLHAGAFIQVAANSAALVAEFRTELARRLDPSALRVSGTPIFFRATHRQASGRTKVMRSSASRGSRV